MVCLSARGIIWKGKTNQLGTQQPLRYTYIKFTHIYIYIYIIYICIYIYMSYTDICVNSVWSGVSLFGSTSMFEYLQNFTLKM